MKKSRLKSFSFLAVLICAAFMSVCSTGSINAFSSEQGEINATLINKSTVASYLYLSNANDIFLNQNQLYVAHEDGVYLKESSQAKPNLILNSPVLKMASINEKTIFLNEQGVFVFNESTPFISGSFSSMCVLNDSIYLLDLPKNNISEYVISLNEQTDVPLNALSASLSREWNLSAYSSKTIGLCATSASVVFYGQNNGVYWFTLLDGSGFRELSLKGIEDDVRFVAGSSQSDKLMVLTATSVYIYSAILSGKIGEPRTIPFSNGRLACFNDSIIYIITSRLNLEQINYGADYASSSVLLGARLNQDWFYAEPSGISIRNEKIFIADKLNDRVVELTKEGFSALGGYHSPISAASTGANQLIVAHNINELTNASTQVTLEIMPLISPVPLIKKMIIDLDDNIFALLEAQNASYLIKTSKELAGYDILPYENPVAIGLKTTGEAYVLANDKLHLIDSENEPLEIGQTLIDFALDYGSNVFGINADRNLVRLSNNDGSFSLTTLNSTQKFDKIAISSMNIQALAGFNDLMLINSTTHSLWKITAADAQVKDAADYFPLDIDKINGIEAHLASNNALAKATESARLYARPLESEINFTLTKEQTIFIRFDIDTPDNMYFAVCESPLTSSLKYGYIFKKYVDLEAFAYTPQSALYAKVLTPNAEIMKYPSSFASTVHTFYSSDMVTILDFYSDYRDYDNKEWTRISLSNGGEGYIRSHLISTSLLTNNFTQMDYNATVINDTIAYIYEASTGEYKPFKDVAKGIRLQIEDFDRRSEFTEVIFYIDGQLIDIKCYIKTADIEYDGLDTIQIVAVCVIAFTLILASAITIVLSKRKRKTS